MPPVGARRSDGERSEPSAAEPQRGARAPAREKLVEGGPNWFPVGVSANINTKMTHQSNPELLNTVLQLPNEEGSGGGRTTDFFCYADKARESLLAA